MQDILNFDKNWRNTKKMSIKQEQTTLQRVQRYVAYQGKIKIVAREKYLDVWIKL